MSVVEEFAEGQPAGIGELGEEAPLAPRPISPGPRRWRPRWPAVGLAVLALVVGSLVVGRATHATQTVTTPVTTEAGFVKLMEHAVNQSFAATYRVSDFGFFLNGTISVARMPSPPGTKATPNSDGYAATGRYTYVATAINGRVVQWILDGSNFSACTSSPQVTKPPHLLCSKLSPYLPSNGFAEEDTGFVPTQVLQTVRSFDQDYRARSRAVTAQSSPQFGPLRCLGQYQVGGPMKEVTCLDRTGAIVSWTSTNGHNRQGVTLTSFSHHPTGKDFTTLVKPTVRFLLPGF